MIREGALDDAAPLAAVSIETWLSTYIKHGVTRAFAEFALAEFSIERMQVALATERIWVAEDKDGIAGYIRISEGHDASVGACGPHEISTLYVQPRHHGKGFGYGLMQAAIAAFGDVLWLKVNCENEAAIAFYLRLGFRRVGGVDFVIDGMGYPNDIMTLGSLKP